MAILAHHTQMDIVLETPPRDLVGRSLEQERVCSVLHCLRSHGDQRWLLSACREALEYPMVDLGIPRDGLLARVARNDQFGPRWSCLRQLPTSEGVQNRHMSLPSAQSFLKFSEEEVQKDFPLQSAASVGASLLAPGSC